MHRPLTLTVLLRYFLRFREFVQHAAKEDGGFSVDEAVAALGMQCRDDAIPGLNITLRPFQLIGVAWQVGTDDCNVYI
jgi:hypothetical protein